MLKLNKDILINIIKASIIWLILFLPCALNLSAITITIDPALEIIVIYCLISRYHVDNIATFVISLFFDQIYSMPLGCNPIIFIIGNYAIRYVSLWFPSRNYGINYIIFCNYVFLILCLRYIVLASLKHYATLSELSSQYLITILIYPLLKFILDRLLSKHVK